MYIVVATLCVAPFSNLSSYEAQKLIYHGFWPVKLELYGRRKERSES